MISLGANFGFLTFYGTINLKQDTIVIEVSDTGPGISNEEMGYEVTQ